MRVYIPHRQRVFIKENGLFDDLGRHRANRIFPEALPDLAARAVMLFRPMAMTDHGVQAILDGAGFTYSMWEGYLTEKGSLRVLKWLERHGLPRRTIHTSGHASVADLKRLAIALAPRTLVPIHSFETGRFHEFFDSVVRKEDKEWWKV